MRRSAARIDSADRECTRILEGLGSLSQDSDWCIGRDTLAAKVAGDNLAVLYIVADLARLEALWM